MSLVATRRPPTAVASQQEDSGELYGIGQLCSEFGISARALRFYEDKGLLGPQRVNGTRVYTRRDRARLQLILRSKAIGASLAEIKHYLELYGAQGEGRVKQLRWVLARTDETLAELEERRAHIDATLTELRAINAEVRERLGERKRLMRVALPNFPSPWLDDELRLLRDASARFFRERWVPQAAQWRQAGLMPRETWREAGAQGLLCAAMPEAFGGGGGTFAHDAVIIEEAARAGLSGFGGGLHSAIVAPYIERYGSGEQKQRWLPQMAAGARVGAIAMTEPGTGSDLQAVRTSAVREKGGDGDHYILNGAKTFITNGQNADLIIVVCKTDRALKAKGTSLIVVETDHAPGFRRGRLLDKVGLKSQDTSELFFDDVRVPVANRLGPEGAGFVQLMEQLPQERLIIALQGIAAMERALDETLAYVKERQAFGQAVWSFQNTRFELADVQATVLATRAFVDACMAAHLKGELDAARAALAKAWVTDRQCEVMDRCLQLFGGYGYMMEYPIAELYVDARVQRIYGGTNEIMKELASRSM